MKGLRLTEEEFARIKGRTITFAKPITENVRIDLTAKQQPAKRSKYGNTPTVVDGITFDSAREAARYSILAARQRAGEITNLRIQVPFVIVPAACINGKAARARKYIADFVYDMPHGLMVVEDSKGMRTAVYMLKRHLMKVVHNIDIQEV